MSNWYKKFVEDDIYKNVAPPGLKGNNLDVLQKYRSSGAQRQQPGCATRMPLLRSSKATTWMWYKRIKPSELKRKPDFPF